MSASIHRYDCKTLGVCQGRQPACSDCVTINVAEHPARVQSVVVNGEALRMYVQHASHAGGARVRVCATDIDRLRYSQAAAQVQRANQAASDKGTHFTRSSVVYFAALLAALMLVLALASGQVLP